MRIMRGLVWLQTGIFLGVAAVILFKSVWVRKTDEHLCSFSRAGTLLLLAVDWTVANTFCWPQPFAGVAKGEGLADGKPPDSLGFPVF